MSQQTADPVTGEPHIVFYPGCDKAIMASIQDSEYQKWEKSRPATHQDIERLIAAVNALADEVRKAAK
jgi:hypothetical protein